MSERAVRTMSPDRARKAAARLNRLKLVELVNVLGGLDVSIAEALADAEAFQGKRDLIYAELKQRAATLEPDRRRRRGNLPHQRRREAP